LGGKRGQIYFPAASSPLYVPATLSSPDRQVSPSTAGYFLLLGLASSLEVARGKGFAVFHPTSDNVDASAVWAGEMA